MVSKQKRFDVLVSALYADIYRYAYWLVGNRSQAEDLVQETWLRGWRSYQSLQDEKSARAWLITILRRENARRFARYQPEMLDVTKVSVSDDTAGPVQNMEQHLLHQAIGALQVEFREPLMLQLIGGFGTDEIAAILGSNKNTVLTRLYRARSKLRDALTPAANLRGNSNG